MCSFPAWWVWIVLISSMVGLDCTHFQHGGSGLYSFAAWRAWIVLISSIVAKHTSIMPSSEPNPLNGFKTVTSVNPVSIVTQGCLMSFNLEDLLKLQTCLLKPCFCSITNVLYRLHGSPVTVLNINAPIMNTSD